MYVNSERCKGTLRTQLKTAIRTKRRGLLSSGMCLHLDDAKLHTVSYRETDLGFKTGDVTPPAIFTRPGPNRFSPFLVSRRSTTWTQLQIG